MASLRRVGAILLHRHGHRAPTRNLFKAPGAEAGSQDSLQNALAEEDSKIWTELLYKQSLPLTTTSGGNIDSQRERFPLKSFSRNNSQSDLRSTPYGMLTSKGFDRMVSVGQYISSGLQVDLTRIAHVQTTHYSRTQTSALAVLTGIASHNESSSRNSDSRRYSSSGDEGKDKRKVLKSVPIRSLKQKSCSMSFYERDPFIAKKLVHTVQSHSRFKDLMSQARFQALEADLVKVLPHLLVASPLSSTGTSSRSSNARFDWLSIFDYYICRRSHDLPVELPELEADVSEVVSQRYRLYFCHAQHLAYFIVPLLFDIVKHAITMALRGKGDTIFSGHDVNILGLLNALGYDQITKDATFWPSYGSHVAFEVSANVGPHGRSRPVISKEADAIVDKMGRVDSCSLVDVESFLVQHQSGLADLIQSLQIEVIVSYNGRFLSTAKEPAELHISPVNGESYLLDSYYSASDSSTAMSSSLINLIAITRDLIKHKFR